MSEDKTTIASITIPLDFCKDISLLSDEINRRMIGDINHNTTEQYVYLGLINDTHFYLHIVHNKDFTPDITYHIYNVMINERMIVESNKNVIVYEFYPERGEQKAVIIQHTSSNNKKILSSDNLKDFFHKIVKAERHDMFLIEYSYDEKCYFTYELDTPPPPMDNLIVESLSLDYVMAGKPLQ